MRIIGHRGCAGLELENSMAALRRASSMGLDGVEFDVRVTSDRELVLCHDKSLSRVSDNSTPIANMTLEQVKRIKLNNGEAVPTLTEALSVLGGMNVVIEAKDNGVATELQAAVSQFPKLAVSYLTFRRQLALDLKRDLPDAKIYLATLWKPLTALRFIKKHQLNGLAVHFAGMNWLTAWLCRRQKLDVVVYTVNRRWLAKFMNYYYPSAGIASNYPDRISSGSK